MFKYYFYTSFTLGKGFSEVEFKDGQILPATDLLPEIKSDFFNGGAEIVLRKAGQYGYFMVKGIDFVNLKKRVDEQGRKVFINFAIRCEIKDYRSLCHLAANYINDRSFIEHYLGNLFIIPYENDYRYNIDVARWNHLVNYLAYSTIETTSNIVKRIASDALDDIRFIVCTRDPKYYSEQANELNKAMKVSPAKSSGIGILVENSSLTTLVPVRTFDKKATDNEEYANFVSSIESFPSEETPVNNTCDNEASEETQEIEVDDNEASEEKGDTDSEQATETTKPASDIKTVSVAPRTNSKCCNGLNKKTLMWAAVVLAVFIFTISKCNSKANKNHEKDATEQVAK